MDKYTYGTVWTDLREVTDAKILLVKFEDQKEFRGALSCFCHLCDEVIRPGGKFQGSFFGTKDIELFFVSKDPNMWISCKRSIKNPKFQLYYVFLPIQLFLHSLLTISIFSTLTESLVWIIKGYKYNL